MKTLLLLLLLLPLSLLAQSQQEMNEEARDEFAKADRAMNKVYQKVVASLDEEGVAKLKAAQRAWLVFRDAEAASVADEMRDGSAAPLLYSGAQARLTKERVAQLKSRLVEE